MPEVITKYPEIVLQVLKSAGVQCGVGAQQQILKACPPERFCSLPGGEICVYGVGELQQATQFSASDFASTATKQSAVILPDFVFALVFLIAGAFLAWLYFKRVKA